MKAPGGNPGTATAAKRWPDQVRVLQPENAAMRHHQAAFEDELATMFPVPHDRKSPVAESRPGVLPCARAAEIGGPV